ncbi:MAG: aspartate carbamoyltransferase [Candidatus Mcinerneyibacterium aminivorans]|uniref:Aspartate carbamoyltransferase n=1 Tax=Candidatus Mcinerneyibacterium aminivorans TaxID=2703815 RepID=A0A5D0MJT3_9BACT|nr:MAG: aspartate carbamoyltransferase [Candidatus Mcinerneyibacterium aminivorans]
MKNKSIISLKDISKDELMYLMKRAKEVKEGKYGNFLEGKIISSLFFEPSTRTRLSFHSAVKRAGGDIIGFASAGSSSTKKGESLGDTIKTVSGYCDLIVMRHHVEGAARRASDVTDLPIINAGDGANQHPTQTFLDIFTMLEKKENLDGLNIGLMGDLKYSRTIHSLLVALSFFGVRLYFISPEALAIPERYTDYLDDINVEYEVYKDFKECGKDLDFLYCTRIQKERFYDPVEYESVAGSYIIDKEGLSYLDEETYIMHPLPRVDEIAVEVDEDQRAIYFEQAHNGVPVRQALIGLLLGIIK